MKTAEHTTASQSHQSQKNNAPFAKKEGDDLFFSEVQTDVQPFFAQQTQTPQNYFFSPSAIQPKLTIGKPNDKYEQEADSVADKVVQNLSETAYSNVPFVQKEAEKEQEDPKLEGKEEGIQRKPIFESEQKPDNEKVQPKLINENPVIQRQEEESNAEEKEEKDTQEMTREPELEQTPDDEGSGDTNAESNSGSSESGEEDESKQEIPPETELPEKETSEKEVTPKEISSAEGKSTPESKEGPVEKEKTSESTEEAKTQEEKPNDQVSENKTETTSELKETKPSEIADSSAQSEKQESSEKDGEVDSTEIPVKTTPPPLPEAGEEMPGQLPEPLTLEISKSEQKNQILSKGATVEEASDGLADKLQRSKGKGQSLDDSTSREMGQQMGADFSDVRIHTNSEAGEMNKEIGAKAFTHGKDIYFNDGQYNTGNKEGKHLLAHELTHTVQQGAVAGKTPSIQRSWGAALGGLAKGAAIAGVKLAIRQLGEMAMGKIMEQITGVKGDQKEKAGDWKTRLMNMDQEMLTGEKQSNDQLNQSKAKAEEELKAKKGEKDANTASPDPLPSGIMALLQKILNFGSGQGSAFGTDKKTEEQAVESGVQQDESGWNQMSSMAREITPLAGENEQDINNLVSSVGQLKESNWRSLPAWQKLFQAGKGIIPGLGGLMEKGKQALSAGLNKLKGMFGENATKFWNTTSQLANGMLNGTGSFQERALKTVQKMTGKMQGDAEQAGNKMVGKAKGTEGQGNQTIQLLMQLTDGRAMKVFNLITTVVQRAMTLMRSIPGRSGQAVRGTFDGVKAQLERGKGMIRRLVEKIRQFVIKVKNAIVRMLKRAWAWMKKTIKKAIEAAKRLLKKAWAKIKELTRKIMAKVKALIKKVTDKIKAFLKPATDWLKKKIIEPIKNMIKRAKDRIKKWWEKRKEKRRKKKSSETDLSKAIQAIHDEKRNYVKDGKITKENSDKVAKKAKRKYKKVFRKIKVIDGKDTWDYDIDLGEKIEKVKGASKKELEFTINKEFKLGKEKHEIKNSKNDIRLLMFSSSPKLLSTHESKEVRKAYNDYLTAIEETDSFSARNTASRLHVPKIVEAIKNFGDPNFPKASAPGLGEISKHKEKGDRIAKKGIKIWELESEHVIPFGSARALWQALTPIFPVRGQLEDREQTTIFIYEGAADKKTNPDETNITKRLREKIDELELNKKVQVSQEFAERGSVSAKENLAEISEALIGILEYIREKSITNTNNAILLEHQSNTEGYQETNGERRAELAGAVPNKSEINEAANKQYQDILSLVTSAIYEAQRD